MAEELTAAEKKLLIDLDRMRSDAAELEKNIDSLDQVCVAMMRKKNFEKVEFQTPAGDRRVARLRTAITTSIDTDRFRETCRELEVSNVDIEAAITPKVSVSKARKLLSPEVQQQLISEKKGKTSVVITSNRGKGKSGKKPRKK